MSLLYGLELGLMKILSVQSRLNVKYEERVSLMIELLQCNEISWSEIRYSLSTGTSADTVLENV